MSDKIISLENLKRYHAGLKDQLINEVDSIEGMDNFAITANEGKVVKFTGSYPQVEVKSKLSSPLYTVESNYNVPGEYNFIAEWRGLPAGHYIENPEVGSVIEVVKFDDSVPITLADIAPELSTTEDTYRYFNTAQDNTYFYTLRYSNSQYIRLYWGSTYMGEWNIDYSPTITLSRTFNNITIQETTEDFAPVAAALTYYVKGAGDIQKSSNYIKNVFFDTSITPSIPNYEESSSSKWYVEQTLLRDGGPEVGLAVWRGYANTVSNPNCFAIVFEKSLSAERMPIYISPAFAQEARNRGEAIYTPGWYLNNIVEFNKMLQTQDIKFNDVQNQNLWYTFIRYGEVVWRLNDNIVDLANYNITLSGTPVILTGDTINMIVPDESPSMMAQPKYRLEPGKTFSKFFTVNEAVESGIEFDVTGNTPSFDGLTWDNQIANFIQFSNNIDVTYASKVCGFGVIRDTVNDQYEYGIFLVVVAGSATPTYYPIYATAAFSPKGGDITFDQAGWVPDESLNRIENLFSEEIFYVNEIGNPQEKWSYITKASRSLYLYINKSLDILSFLPDNGGAQSAIITISYESKNNSKTTYVFEYAKSGTNYNTLGLGLQGEIVGKFYNQGTWSNINYSDVKGSSLSDYIYCLQLTYSGGPLEISITSVKISQNIVNQFVSVGYPLFDFAYYNNETSIEQAGRIDIEAQDLNKIYLNAPDQLKVIYDNTFWKVNDEYITLTQLGLLDNGSTPLNNDAIVIDFPQEYYIPDMLYQILPEGETYKPVELNLNHVQSAIFKDKVLTLKTKLVKLEEGSYYKAYMYFNPDKTAAEYNTWLASAYTSSGDGYLCYCNKPTSAMGPSDFRALEVISLGNDKYKLQSNYMGKVIFDGDQLLTTKMDLTLLGDMMQVTKIKGNWNNGKFVFVESDYAEPQWADHFEYTAGENISIRDGVIKATNQLPEYSLTDSSSLGAVLSLDLQFIYDKAKKEISESNPYYYINTTKDFNYDAFIATDPKNVGKGVNTMYVLFSTRENPDPMSDNAAYSLFVGQHFYLILYIGLFTGFFPNFPKDAFAIGGASPDVYANESYVQAMHDAAAALPDSGQTAQIKQLFMNMHAGWFPFGPGGIQGESGASDIFGLVGPFKFDSFPIYHIASQDFIEQYVIPTDAPISNSLEAVQSYVTIGGGSIIKKWDKPAIFRNQMRESLTAVGEYFQHVGPTVFTNTHTIEEDEAFKLICFNTNAILDWYDLKADITGISYSSGTIYPLISKVENPSSLDDILLGCAETQGPRVLVAFGKDGAAIIWANGTSNTGLWGTPHVKGWQEIDYVELASKQAWYVSRPDNQTQNTEFNNDIHTADEVLLTSGTIYYYAGSNNVKALLPYSLEKDIPIHMVDLGDSSFAPAENEYYFHDGPNVVEKHDVDPTASFNKIIFNDSLDVATVKTICENIKNNNTPDHTDEQTGIEYYFLISNNGAEDENVLLLMQYYPAGTLGEEDGYGLLNLFNESQPGIWGSIATGTKESGWVQSSAEAPSSQVWTVKYQTYWNDMVSMGDPTILYQQGIIYFYDGTSLKPILPQEHLSNEALLSTYTQTEANLADAVSKKHTHTNQAILDSIPSISSLDTSKKYMLTVSFVSDEPVFAWEEVTTSV